MNHQNNVLVTGGTGKTGRRIVQRLEERNVGMRIGSRAATPAFDWEKEATWKPALEGINSVYIAYQPDLAVPGAGETIQKFVDTAVKSKVERIVLLSGRGEPEAQLCEKVVEQSGAAWTVVRASFFSQNFSEGFLVDSIRNGEIVLPIVNVAEPFIDVDDIADVATAALTEDGHNGQVYDVTGPRLMTFDDAIGEIAQAVGRSIPLISVPMAAYTQGTKEAGVPEDYIWLIEYLFTTVFDGRNASVSDGVQRALGREPRDFSEYVRQVAESGVWNTPVATPS